ncbi:hypothetical protein Tco_0467727 [Tanacetum coccineum]
MVTMAENVIAAGSETCPPMLEKGMYDSWKTQIILYIRDKQNGEMLKVSIDNGPYQFKSEITVKDTDGVTKICRPQRLEDLAEKTSYVMTVTSKLSIYFFSYFQLTSTLSSTTIKLQKFTSKPRESMHSYYLRFTKLINDMRMIPMTMSPMKINTKFVNHLQPEWSRFVTAAKQAKDLHSVNFDQLYAFLKHNEKDAKEVREMRQRFPEPLALLANTYHPLLHT